MAEKISLYSLLHAEMCFEYKALYFENNHLDEILTKKVLLYDLKQIPIHMWLTHNKENWIGQFSTWLSSELGIDDDGLAWLRLKDEWLAI